MMKVGVQFITHVSVIPCNVSVCYQFYTVTNVTRVS